MISTTGLQGVDFDKFPTAKKLVDRCHEFFSEISDLTPGRRLEEHLNKNYGPGNEYYDDFVSLVRQGHSEGWTGLNSVDGGHLRATPIEAPCADSRFFSITTVHMTSAKEDEYHSRVRHHVHPYGEINCVVQITDGAQLEGFQGWRGPGWTAPGPGTHHDPSVRNGEIVALFFLPAGRISYSKNPSDPQPECV